MAAHIVLPWVHRVFSNRKVCGALAVCITACAAAHLQS